MKKQILAALMLLAAGNANAGESGDCGGKLVEYKRIMAPPYCAEASLAKRGVMKAW